MSRLKTHDNVKERCRQVEPEARFPTDEAAVLGRQIGELAGAVSTDAIHGPDWYHACDVVEVLEGRLSTVQARSLEGAMAQAVLLTADVSSLDDDMSGYQRECLHRRMKRLVYSITAVLEGESGVAREAVGADTYAPHHRDPHQSGINFAPGAFPVRQSAAA
jgi:hypothetical protein